MQALIFKRAAFQAIERGSDVQAIRCDYSDENSR